MNDNNASEDLLGLTAEIVSAHVSNNSVLITSLPDLITEVHRTLSSLSSSAVPVAPIEAKAPAVPPKKSITPDYLICLEDGKKVKMLKPHLKTAYAMTPGEYREKWGLAKDYPMVAPNYAARRATIARESGLGRKAGS